MTTHEIHDIELPAQSRTGGATTTGVISAFTNNCAVDVTLKDLRTSPGHEMSITGDDKWDMNTGTLKPGGRVTLSVTGMKDADESAFGSLVATVQNTNNTSSEIHWQSDRGRNPHNWTQSRYSAQATGEVALKITDRDDRVVVANLMNGARKDTTSTESRYALWAYYNWQFFSTAQPGPPPPPPEPGTAVTVTPDFRGEFEEGWGDNRMFVYSHRLTIAAGQQAIKTWELRFFLPDGLTLHKVWLGRGEVVETSKGRLAIIRNQGHLEAGKTLPVDFHLGAAAKDETFKKLREPKGYRVN